MKKHILPILLTAAFIVGSLPVYGQVRNAGFSFSNGSSALPQDDIYRFRDASGEPLAIGSVVQFGVMQPNDFSSFTAITGLGSANYDDGTDTETRIGDGGREIGEITANVSLSTAQGDVVPNDPGLLFAVRFFDSVDSVNAAFNSFYHPDWTWQVSIDSPAVAQTYGMSTNSFLGKATGFVFEFPDAVGFDDQQRPDDIRTIPEPSTGALLAVGLLAAVTYRRRLRA